MLDMAHCNRMWAQGHTTTDLEDTPGRHLPGALESKLIQPRYDALNQYPDKSPHTSEDQPNNDATHTHASHRAPAWRTTASHRATT